MVLAHNIDEGHRTRDIEITQDVTFDSMLLANSILQGLKDSGFHKPSPVQLHGIPLGKCGFDLLLEAKSGTGKTAVFSIIALEKLDLCKGLQVVILAPTREIAAQICDVIKQIGSKLKGLVVEVVMGGLPVQEDISKFEKNVHIVVGSPGRLRHLIQDKHINIGAVRLLVFDEADKLMEKSFQADINFIFSVLPHQKQVILSSATYTETAKTFVSKYVQSVQHIRPDHNCILLGIDQKITVVKFNANIVRQTQYKFDELIKILSKKAFKQCLIFCNYQARVTELHKLLSRQKWPAEQLYGQQEQIERLDALKTLQDYKCRILISTDLAARGIDASNVDLVVNFEPPFEWQTYLHRIGRTGRYGSYGTSITILSEGKEEKKFKNMLLSMNVPLKISSLWINDNIDFDVSVENLPTNNLLDSGTTNKYKELWKEFTTHLACDTQELDNFETLCKSFESAQTAGVQSFDDLLISFKSENISSVQENKYQHIAITTKAIEELGEILNHIKSSCSNPTLTEKTKCSSINITDVTKINNDECIRDDSIYTRPTKELKDKENRYFNESDTEILSKAQVGDALPVSFSSRRHSKKHDRNSSINKKPNLTVSKDNSSNTLNLQQCYSPTTTTKINSSKKSTYPDINKNSSHFKPVQEKDKFKNTARSNEIEEHSYYLSQNYVDWYNQLKYRMKQIEYSLYIEEMSQLYTK